MILSIFFIIFIALIMVDAIYRFMNINYKKYDNSEDIKSSFFLKDQSTCPTFPDFSSQDQMRNDASMLLSVVHNK